MRYFLDEEFIERGPKHPIELISIGIVAEDGRELYMISNEFDPSHANEWVREHVLMKLGDEPTSSLKEIASAIWLFCDPEKYGESEFWGYFSSYDWVVFCQIFGTMMDLPHDYPMWCRDLKQLAVQRGIERLPQPIVEHNALADARWNKQSYDFIEFYEAEKMTEILRLKRIAEDTQKMFDAQRNSDTPHSVAVHGGAMTVEFSPRDVGDMHRIIHHLSNASMGDDWIACRKQAQRFLDAHKPMER